MNIIHWIVIFVIISGIGFIIKYVPPMIILGVIYMGVVVFLIYLLIRRLSESQ